MIDFLGLKVGDVIELRLVGDRIRISQGVVAPVRCLSDASIYLDFDGVYLSCFNDDHGQLFLTSKNYLRELDSELHICGVFETFDGKRYGGRFPVVARVLN